MTGSHPGVEQVRVVTELRGHRQRRWEALLGRLALIASSPHPSGVMRARETVDTMTAWCVLSARRERLRRVDQAAA